MVSGCVGPLRDIDVRNVVTLSNPQGGHTSEHVRQTPIGVCDPIHGLLECPVRRSIDAGVWFLMGFLDKILNDALANINPEKEKESLTMVEGFHWFECSECEGVFVGDMELSPRCCPYCCGHKIKDIEEVVVHGG